MPKCNTGVNPETMLSGVEHAKAQKLAEINEQCDAMLGGLTKSYPGSELLTFDQQKAEAEAYLADNTTHCPLLAPLAAARGIELEDLCTRVIAKATAFSAASGAIIGQRQKFEDLLGACTTIDQVAAIEVSYALPGVGA